MVKTMMAAAGALLVLVAGPAAAQPEVAARTQAQAVIDATLDRDHETLAALTYAPLVQTMGGREAMIAAVEKMLAELDEMQFRMVSATIDSAVRIVPGTGRLFAVVPYTLVMEGPDATIRSPTALLGISSDGGAQWTFLSGGTLSPAVLGTFFPDEADLAARLRVSEQQSVVTPRAGSRSTPPEEAPSTRPAKPSA